MHPSNTATASTTSPSDDIAVIEVANEFEASPVASPALSQTEAPLLDATPALLSAPPRPLELTIDKTADPNNTNFGFIFETTSTTTYRRGDPFRHGGSTMNILFYDGHAATRNCQDAYIYFWNPREAR